MRGFAAPRRTRPYVGGIATSNATGTGARSFPGRSWGRSDHVALPADRAGVHPVQLLVGGNGRGRLARPALHLPLAADERGLPAAAPDPPQRRAAALPAARGADASRADHGLRDP